MIEANMSPSETGRRTADSVKRGTWRRQILGGACLATLGAIALLAQGIGLRSLVAFGGEKESWKAAQAQRQSLIQEHPKLIDERMSDLGKVQRTYQELTAETDAARTERGQFTSELTTEIARLIVDRDQLSKSVVE